jgi:hypothetical protein
MTDYKVIRHILKIYHETGKNANRRTGNSGVPAGAVADLRENCC